MTYDYVWFNKDLNNEIIKIFEELLKKETGCNSIVYDFEESYIDHQSIDTLCIEMVDKRCFDTKDYILDASKTYEFLRNLIFNYDSVIIIDNDNH